jgi:hypothetical protein
MFCSGCGQSMQAGQGFCPRCGRPMAVAIPPVPGLQFQLDSYAGKVRALSIVWFIYAGLSLLMSFVGMAFARAFMNNHFGSWPHGPWMNGPFRPEWFGPAFLHFIWVFVLLRADGGHRRCFSVSFQIPHGNRSGHLDARDLDGLPQSVALRAVAITAGIRDQLVPSSPNRHCGLVPGAVFRDLALVCLISDP